MNLSAIQKNALPSFSDRSTELQGKIRWMSQKSEGDYFGLTEDDYLVGGAAVGAVGGAVGGAVAGAKLEGPLAAVGLGAIGVFVGAVVGLALGVALASARW